MATSSQLKRVLGLETLYIRPDISKNIRLQNLLSFLPTQTDSGKVIAKIVHDTDTNEAIMHSEYSLSKSVSKYSLHLKVYADFPK